MAVALEKFVKQIEESGIVAPGKLENFVPPKAHPKDAEELARQLVKADHLTPFQAQHVLLGKVKALILGNYTVLDKIGAGGMGQVFKAEHRRMKRVVAIKMLPPAVTKDALAAARFQREVEAASKLLHPNIVSAFDADEANGAHFLVMEYVEGKDLSAHVKKNGPFSVDKAVNYILQAAKGLEFAHAEGVIHRDIKPANLLLDKKGVVKILDMGLARIDAPGGDIAAQAELTGTGAIMGTVDYMAPEQGVSTKDADARADIYSLGCTLHYLLIGKPVYGGESVGAKFLAHHNQPIPDLCALRDDVPQQVNAIFRKMVAKKVEERYQTMIEVIAELQACGLGHDQSLTMQRSSSSNLENSALTFLKNIPIGTTHKPTKKPSPASGGNGKKKLIYGAVAGGFLFVVLGVWIIIKNEKGEEIKRVEVPDKHSLELVPGKPGPAKVVAEPAGPPKPLVTPFDAKQAHAGQEAWAKYLKTTVEQKNPEGMTLVLIPPGEFLMGSTPEQNALGRKIAEDAKLKPDDYAWARLKEEGPQHRVAITKPYWLGMTEVTIGQFKKFVEATKYVTQAEQFGFGNSSATKPDDKTTPEMKKMTWRTPGYAVTDDSPVTQVTWNDALQFCNWLSEQEKLEPCYRQDAKDGWILLPMGTGYRLPTEAEWEYACRAGTTTQFSFGDDPAMLDIYGWFNKNAGGSARAVGTKVANAFDLFDMHGNAYEWCHDFYAGDYYSKSSPADPFGPTSGSYRVSRGGPWLSSPVSCRSAYRHNNAPVYRYGNSGFRVLRVLDASADSRLAAGVTAHQPKQPWNTPAFQAWMKNVQAMPAEKQVEAVSKKLMELNPGFDGKVTGWDGTGSPKIENTVLTEFGFLNDNVTDISPIRALAGLNRLQCGGRGRHSGKLADLTPLRGLPLTSLDCRDSLIADLSPLQGMKLTHLSCNGTQVNSLAMLKGMNLGSLDCGGTPVSDLSPLQGMELTDLKVHDTPVTDLSPLRGMTLTALDFNRTRVSDLSPLKGMPITRLGCYSTSVSDLSPLESCKSLKILNAKDTNVTASTVAALQKALPNCKIDWDRAASVASHQAIDLPPQGSFTITYSPGEKHTVLGIEGMEVRRRGDKGELDTYAFQRNADGSVRLAHSAGYEIWRKSEAGIVIERWKSKSEYDAGMPPPLIGKLKPTSDGAAQHSQPWNTPAFQQWIKTVKAMPAEKQIDAVSKKLVELNPGFDGKVTDKDQKGAPKVEDGVVTELRVVTDNVTDISPLRALAGLKYLNCGSNTTNGKLTNLSPLQGMQLTTLTFIKTQVSDLSPLKGMPLTRLFCSGTQVSDLSPIKGMPLMQLGCNDTHVSDLSDVREMPLYFLWCYSTQVSDLSPLQGMNLTDVRFTPKKITKGLEVIRQMKSLQTIGTYSTESSTFPPEEFWKKYDAGEFGTPAASAKPIANINAPTFQAWMKTVQALPAEKQIEAVSKKLMELNPGFDGKMAGAWGKSTPKIEDGVVTELRFFTDSATNISPVQALVGLKVLECGGSRIGKSRLSDLSCLQGINLTGLECFNSEVSDLSPLQGMKLTHLGCGSTQVSDLSSLKGMPLIYLNCEGTQVSDLSPLEACKNLKGLRAKSTRITAANVVALQKALPTCNISWDDPAKATKPITNVTDPAFQQWIKDVQVLPAEKLIEAVSKKLVELNPGFDGKATGVDNGRAVGTPKIENGVVTEFGIISDNVTDISPVRAFTGLKTLRCAGGYPRNGKLSDLSPLQGLPLIRLYCHGTQVSDLSPLRGMPLKELTCYWSNVSDLSPVQGSPLTSLKCAHTQVGDLSTLQGMRLTILHGEYTEISDLSPLKEMPLAELQVNNTKVTDLLPLRGMNLRELWITPTKITKGLDIIRQMKSLKTIGTAYGENFPPVEFWKKYDAGEFGKPITNINDPAFQAWMKSVQALPAEKQVEVVSKKLLELNPEFDWQVTPKVENGVVTEFAFRSDNLTDISPVRALARLKVLVCTGSGTGSRADKGKLSDLSPLQGMRLTYLNCSTTLVSDFSPLRGMPLRELQFKDTLTSDISPLTSMSTLTKVKMNRTKVTAAAVAALQKALPNCKIEWDDPAKPKTPEPTDAGTK